jgi:ArsR family transcriptional regulator
MNMKNLPPVEKISKVLELIAAPVRLGILISIGEGEACVCHLEAVLKKRQAYISQHLMALRGAGVITARRDGRFVYYRLANPALLDLIRDAARLAGADASPIVPPKGCQCPGCESAGSPGPVALHNLQASSRGA